MSLEDVESTPLLFFKQQNRKVEKTEST